MDAQSLSNSIDPVADSVLQAVRSSFFLIWEGGVFNLNRVLSCSLKTIKWLTIHLKKKKKYQAEFFKCFQLTAWSLIKLICMTCHTSTPEGIPNGHTENRPPFRFSLQESGWAQLTSSSCETCSSWCIARWSYLIGVDRYRDHIQTSWLSSEKQSQRISSTLGNLK